MVCVLARTPCGRRNTRPNTLGSATACGSRSQGRFAEVSDVAERGSPLHLPRRAIAVVRTSLAALAGVPADRVAWMNATDFSQRCAMKSYDSRTYSINDFIEWERNKQLELNPAFQRRAVWNDKAKSYLIDTILREKPIPKVFIRQKINVLTKTSMRDVVDGQQRIRTILSFIKDGFVVSPRQNKEFGGKVFSDLPEDTQAQLLSYEISVDLLINLPDADILDIFGRLNSYAVILNEQEKINALHFGPFKLLADSIGRKYYDYWTKQNILTKQQVLRMQEVNLVADLLIALREGIKSKKQITKFYNTYENEYDDDVAVVEKCFDDVIEKIAELYPEGLVDTEFSRVHLYYTLFTAVAHCLYGLKGLAARRHDLNPAGVQRARNGLDRVSEIFADPTAEGLSETERTFVQDSRRATTDETVRSRRAAFLLGLMG